MYAYDKAHELAQALADSSEYKAYKEAKSKIDGNEKAKDMINRFKKKQFEVQAEQMSGKNPDESTMQQLQALSTVLAVNPDIVRYLTAEMAFHQMFSDLYKILLEKVDIDFDFLK